MKTHSAMLWFLVVLTSFVAFPGCQPSTTDQAEPAGFPLESTLEPALEWTFDDCQKDPAWSSFATSNDPMNPDAPPINVEWIRMAAESEADGSCHARLDFDAFSAATGPTLDKSLVGDGLALSFEARFPPCYATDDRCLWSVSIAGEPFDGWDAGTLWKYALEAEAFEGEFSTHAVAYRGSPYGGKDLANVDLPVAAEVVAPDEWHSYALVVDRTKRRFTLYVDGIQRGEAVFEYDTKSHIEALIVTAETRKGAGDSRCGAGGPPEELHCHGAPGAAVLFLDDVRLYVLSANDLARLSP